MKKFIKVASSAPKPNKRLKKSCTGCSDYFTCYQQANYDYCRSCAINGNRYAQNQCPECGDGSGTVKFPGKPPRRCKTCALTKPKLVSQRSPKKCSACGVKFPKSQARVCLLCSLEPKIIHKEVKRV